MGCSLSTRHVAGHVQEGGSRLFVYTPLRCLTKPQKPWPKVRLASILCWIT